MPLCAQVFSHVVAGSAGFVEEASTEDPGGSPPGADGEETRADTPAGVIEGWCCPPCVSAPECPAAAVGALSEGAVGEDDPPGRVDRPAPSVGCTGTDPEGDAKGEPTPVAGESNSKSMPLLPCIKSPSKVSF